MNSTQTEYERSSLEIDQTAEYFHKHGTLLYRSVDKHIYQCGDFVMKEILLDPIPNLEQIVLLERKQLDNNNKSSDLSVAQLLSSSMSSQQTSSFAAGTETQRTHTQQFDPKKQLEKRQYDCLLLQREFIVSQWFRNRPNSLHIIVPNYFGISKSRVMLLSPLMNQRDALMHLIQRNENIFSLIIRESAIRNNGNSVSESQQEHQQEVTYRLQVNALTMKQKLILNHVRFILFGSMRLLVEISEALLYMHSHLGIAHNDLKPDNIFAHYSADSSDTAAAAVGGEELNQSATEKKQVKIEDDEGVGYYLADFAYSKPVGFASETHASEFFGAKLMSYCSPEILELVASQRRNQAATSTQVIGSSVSVSELGELEKRGDVFALGVSLFQILFQVNPYENRACYADDVRYSELSKNRQNFWARVENQLLIYDRMTDVQSMQNLIEGMLNADPKQRFNIQQVYTHPWLLKMREYLIGLKQK